jgi:hypothetical protein
MNKFRAFQPGTAMSANPQPEPDRLDAAADQAIAACGGDMRETIKALIVANKFLESELSEPMKATARAKN